MGEKLQLLTEWTPLTYTVDMIKESKNLNSGKIMLKGVLQKCNTLNQNGRVYPQVILEREVRNYQKFIHNLNFLFNLLTTNTPPNSLYTNFAKDD